MELLFRGIRRICEQESSFLSSAALLQAEGAKRDGGRAISEVEDDDDPSGLGDESTQSMSEMTYTDDEEGEEEDATQDTPVMICNKG